MSLDIAAMMLRGAFRQRSSCVMSFNTSSLVLHVEATGTRGRCWCVAWRLTVALPQPLWAAVREALAEVKQVERGKMTAV